MAIPLLGIGAVAAPVIGGLLGNRAAGEAAGAANQAMQDALGQIARVETPNIDLMKLQLQNPELAGQLTPEMIQALQLGPSAMEGVSTDPRLQQAQMSALMKMSQIGEQGGLTDADRAALELARRQAAGESEAKQQQILQEMQSRGQGGQGAELIARLKAAQASSDRQAAEGLNINQMAQARALQALSAAGQMGGQARQQEFGEKSNIAKAKDIVNAFNVQNAQNTQNTNVGAKNQAQAQNLQLRQQLANAAAANANQQQQYNKELLQRDYENKMKKAAAMAGMYGNIANQQQAEAGRIGSMYGTIGSGIGAGLGALAGMTGGSSGGQTKSSNPFEALSNMNDGNIKKSYV